MEATRSTPAQRAAAVAAAMLLATGGAAFAQQSNNTTAKLSKPAAAKRAAPAANTASSDYWTVKYDLPPDYETSSRPRIEERTPLSRVPLKGGGGTIGLSSITRNEGEFYDGRAVPGINPNTRDSSSFVGFSLTLPSSPTPTPWNRIE